MQRRLIELTADLSRLPSDTIPVRDKAQRHAALCREREGLGKKLGAKSA
jgi:hypothetical protein